ncbi:hypothetical protein N5V81_14215 [Escherichia coli]|nr:hypothetical protein [Escherichia coli]
MRDTKEVIYPGTHEFPREWIRIAESYFGTGSADFHYFGWAETITIPFVQKWSCANVVRIYLEPAAVHSSFWGPVDASQYATALRMSQKEREMLTVQLLHTALEDIFYSVPEMPNARMEPLLEPYTGLLISLMMLR